MTEITEVPSPFCGIGSDDLTIQADGVSIKVTKNGCAVNTPAFEQAITDTSPRVDGKEVSLEWAVVRAVKILKAANQPVIGGCATDVNGMRALMALADRSGSVVDNMNFTGAKRNILAMQDSGWMNTTLAEIKNRCDLFIVVGCDLEAFSPRFYERYLWNKESMFLDDTADREVIYIGKPPSGSASTSPNKAKAKVLECADADLPEVVAVLKALIKGNGPFEKYGAAEALVIYFFDDLVLLAQPKFPDRFAWLLTDAIVKLETQLPGAISPLKVEKIIEIHPGTLMALNNEKIPELKK